jgi:hypothetical protein
MAKKVYYPEDWVTDVVQKLVATPEDIMMVEHLKDVPTSEHHPGRP